MLRKFPFEQSSESISQVNEGSLVMICAKIKFPTVMLRACSSLTGRKVRGGTIFNGDAARTRAASIPTPGNQE